jgi:hypothetical protein
MPKPTPSALQGPAPTGGLDPRLQGRARSNNALAAALAPDISEFDPVHHPGVYFNQKQIDTIKRLNKAGPTAAERCIDVLQALIVYFTIFIVGFLIINGLGEMITRLLAANP